MNVHSPRLLVDAKQGQLDNECGVSRSEKALADAAAIGIMVVWTTLFGRIGIVSGQPRCCVLTVPG
ncbi:MAG: hypothetical protein F9B45_11550 [Phycisphaera sp. RhM]|nr:hypothetical protein [Phycisphaera sp. RhM]